MASLGIKGFFPVTGGQDRFHENYGKRKSPAPDLAPPLIVRKHISPLEPPAKVQNTGPQAQPRRFGTRLNFGDPSKSTRVAIDILAPPAPESTPFDMARESLIQAAAVNPNVVALKPGQTMAVFRINNQYIAKTFKQTVINEETKMPFTQETLKGKLEQELKHYFKFLVASPHVARLLDLENIGRPLQDASAPIQRGKVYQEYIPYDLPEKLTINHLNVIKHFLQLSFETGIPFDIHPGNFKCRDAAQQDMVFFDFGLSHEVELRNQDELLAVMRGMLTRWETAYPGTKAEVLKILDDKIALELSK